MAAVSVQLKVSPAAPVSTEQRVVETFDRMYPKLLRYTLRLTSLPAHDSEEVVQDAFLALHCHLKSGKPLSNLDAWMFQVTHNLGLRRASNTRRETRRSVRIEGAGEEIAPDPRPTPESAFAERAARSGVASALAALPPLDRQCLALRSEGLRYREIAGILGMSLGAVAKSLEKSFDRVARVTRRHL